MIGLGLIPSAKLAVIWIINPKVLLDSEPNIGFNLFYIRFFNVNFEHLELFFFTLYISFLNCLSNNE